MSVLYIVHVWKVKPQGEHEKKTMFDPRNISFQINLLEMHLLKDISIILLLWHVIGCPTRQRQMELLQQ